MIVEMVQGAQVPLLFIEPLVLESHITGSNRGGENGGGGGGGGGRTSYRRQSGGQAGTIAGRQSTVSFITGADRP
jgi:hypothetical protein